MLENIKQRSKCKRFWISIAAFIPIALYTMGFEMSVLPENYEILVAAVLNLLIAMGIIDTKTGCTDPTHKHEEEIDSVEPGDIEEAIKDVVKAKPKVEE